MNVDMTIREWAEFCRTRMSEDEETDFLSCLGCLYEDVCRSLVNGCPPAEVFQEDIP